MLLEIFETFSRDRGNLDPLRALKEGALEGLSHILLNQLQELLLNGIDLGDDDHAVAEPENLHDGQVLASLRHDAIVGGDHEEHQVDSRGAGDHVLDQPFVPGDIDDTHPQTVLQRQGRKTQVDRQPPAFFFRKPVGIDAGQTLDHAAFSMVYMPGRTDDDVKDLVVVRSHRMLKAIILAFLRGEVIRVEGERLG